MAESDQMLTEIDAFILAIELETLSNLRAKHVAFIAGPAGGCRFFVECARNRAYPWSVFDNMSDAAAWLHENEGNLIAQGAAPAGPAAAG